ncbi:MAG: 16S rRNA (adenine(1518)-N(6)/adenine(1519)-N(6))-dimethyltransferase RsmA [Candidatus Bathyarchaeota archaeon]|nr:16S rRNA (adenine(1518)-N(6)/adenine(1519)-N(6))-dimethyltransferase RsmA [Candidatus Bathyarchaeota archaeon]
MSLEETKLLLRTHRIAPNRLLGQNFMVEPALYPKLSDYASLSKTDVVLDAGAGFGFLTRFLSEKCQRVVAVEKDAQVADVLRERLRGVDNVTVIEGDLLKTDLPEFNKAVAVPPYYLSSRLVLWLLERKIDCAVLVLQQEFAERLVAAVGSEAYGWLTVVAWHRVEVELLDAVAKELFYPQPEVDSVIVRLMSWKQAPFEVKDEAFFKQMARWLFTQRNKKVSNALEPFLRSTRKLSKQEAARLAEAVPFRERRARDLLPRDFGELANVLAE